MHLQINLAKKTFIYYAIIGPVISLYSLYNVIYGIILHKTATVGIGAFSLLGFIIIPLGLYTLYKNNRGIITTEHIRIGKDDYPFSKYSFQVKEKELTPMQRPLFSPFKKTYYDLVIREIDTKSVVLEKDLDISRRDIEKIKNALPFQLMHG